MKANDVKQQAEYARLRSSSPTPSSTSRCSRSWLRNTFDPELPTGITSKICSRQTPAIGQAVTFRTELPQASRVVIPTDAKRLKQLEARERAVEEAARPGRARHKSMRRDYIVLGSDRITSEPTTT